MSSAAEAAAADMLLAARARRSRAAALADAGVPHLATRETGAADVLAVAAAHLLSPPPPALDEVAIRADERARIAEQLDTRMVENWQGDMRHASGHRQAAAFVRGLS